MEVIWESPLATSLMLGAYVPVPSRIDMLVEQIEAMLSLGPVIRT